MGQSGSHVAPGYSQVLAPPTMRDSESLTCRICPSVGDMGLMPSPWQPSPTPFLLPVSFPSGISAKGYCHSNQGSFHNFSLPSLPSSFPFLLPPSLLLSPLPLPTLLTAKRHPCQDSGPDHPPT